MESPAHAALKVAAIAWLRAQGCAAAACEVRCPISRYRVDAAGYADPPPPPPPPPPATRAGAPSRKPPGPPGLRLGTTVFIECKASRADFLRDTRERPRLLAARERLWRELDHVRAEVVRPLEPHLRQAGNFLFPEMEQWDYSASNSAASRAILRELRRIDRALHDHTKFFMLAQYRLANTLLILAPDGLVEPQELPRHWGLLALPVRSGSSDRPTVPRVVREPTPLDPVPARVLRTLRNIAAARP